MVSESALVFRRHPVSNMDSLEPSQGYASIGLVACVAYLTATRETSLVLERPTPSWVIILFVCSLVLLLSDRIRLYFSRDARQAQEYTVIPLENLNGDAHSLSPPPPGRLLKLQSLPLSKQWLHRGLLALILTLRIEIFRRIDPKSSATSLETIVPIFIALADCWQNSSWANKNRNHGHEHSTTRQALTAKSILRYILSSLIYAAVFSWFAALAISYSPSSLNSTYISGRHFDSFTTTSPLQTVGVVLDVILGVYSTLSLDPAAKVQIDSTNKPTRSAGLSFLISAASCLILGIASSIFGGTGHVFYRPENFVLRILKVAGAAGFMTFFAIHVIRYSGVLDTSLLILCTISAVSLAIKSWNPPTAFLDAHEFKALIPMGLLVGVVLHSVADFTKEWAQVMPQKADHRRRRWSLFHIYGALFAIQMLLIHWGQLELEFHQVDTLIHNAKRRHDAWLQTASSSTSLTEATQNYITRYNQTPPPHFDVWYEYATNRSSLVIDEFDTIYEDLLPFWSLSPAEIRKRTKESLNSPTGGVGGIIIRGGVASISGNTPGTHKWELNGIIDIIDKFGKYLPDMDLAFNLNDECRVSIPYHELEKSRTAALQESAARKDGLGSLSNGFSEGRAEGWEVVPSEPLDLQRFIVLSFQNTWDFSSAHCPPDSAARLNRHLDPNTFCASCAAPHSLDVFLSNWTLAGDVCHQPDLGQLHGFYISPSAMDATPQLMPIFSQSKVGGFNDIRYPSPWNYIDKTRYDPNEEFPDPEFEAKQNAIFWRGATSEGFSKGGTGAWRGMSRQRFIGLLSNPSAAQALLLPDPQQHIVDDDTVRLRLRYALVDPSHLRDSIATDTRFTDVVRCDPPDCDDQIAQFGGLGDRTDFQAHWRYRYLLDIDGAGFSGRFLPFLQSRSLPFKTALFREWWETRVAEWVHFVPLDLRAHGAWATLAYFAGFQGSVEGETVSWPPHYLQAKALADEGALWARKVLRKEDMEIYMFRLLLEWGRLTDDRRADIGFTGRTS